MPPERQRLLWPWLLTAAIAIVAFDLSRAGIADFLRLGPCAYLDRVQASGQRPDPQKLGAARDRLELARKIDPGNPVVYEYLGIVYFHRANIVTQDLPLRMGYLEAARNHYDAALGLRPNSGYLWAGMAVIRAALLEIRQAKMAVAPGDARSDGANDLGGLRQALMHASRLAPWEAPVLKIIVTTGRRHYQALDLEARSIVDAAARRAGNLK